MVLRNVRIPSWSRLALLFVAFSFLKNPSSGDVGPYVVSRLVSDQFLKNPQSFIAWDYGGALIFDGLFQVNQTFGINYEPIIDQFLDSNLKDPASYACKLLNNIPVPFGQAIGDSIGLFPIAYLNRYISRRTGSTESLVIAWRTVEQYIIKFPNHLDDGTVSRDEGWPGEIHVNASFLWADDQYMGLTLASRLAAFIDLTDYARFVIEQRLLFNHHLQRELGLFYHGYNDADARKSCCKWGRGNGWSMMATVEVLTMLDKFQRFIAERGAILGSFRRQAEALAKHQSLDGRWHQVVDEPSTFLETSATAMFISALARGVTNRWLDAEMYEPILDRAWSGLERAINHDGTVNGVCSGTGIQVTLADYEARPTAYLDSRNGGVGSVLLAAVDYFKMKQKLLSQDGINRNK